MWAHLSYVAWVNTGFPTVVGSEILNRFVAHSYRIVGRWPMLEIVDSSLNRIGNDSDVRCYRRHVCSDRSLVVHLLNSASTRMLRILARFPEYQLGSIFHTIDDVISAGKQLVSSLRYGPKLRLCTLLCTARGHAFYGSARLFTQLTM